MTFLKYILSILIIATAISSSFLIFGGKREEQPLENSYILKYENEQVALFKNGEITETFENINFDDLPYIDREDLRKGIKRSSYEEILSLVEDFDG